MKDEKATLSLFRTHRVALGQYARAIATDSTQAEDVVQEAWLKLQRAPDAETIRDPLSYLYRIVRNLAIDTRRRLGREAARNITLDDGVAETISDAAPSPEQDVTARSELRVVLDALAELPERTQIAIRMNRIEGKKLSDVATHLGLSPGRVHVLIAEGVAYCDRRRIEKARGFS